MPAKTREGLIETRLLENIFLFNYYYYVNFFTSSPPKKGLKRDKRFALKLKIKIQVKNNNQLQYYFQCAKLVLCKKAAYNISKDESSIGAVKRDEEKKSNNKFLLFDLKDFNICKIYILVDIQGNCRKSRFIQERKNL